MNKVNSNGHTGVNHGGHLQLNSCTAIDSIMLQCVSNPSQAKFYVQIEVQGVKPYHNQLVSKYKSRAIVGQKEGPHMRYEWTIQEPWTYLESTILVTISRHHILRSDQVVVATPVHLKDVITHLVQKPKTAYTITPKFGHTISICLQAKIFQNFLNQVQLSTTLAHSGEMQNHFELLLTIGSTFSEFLPLVQSIIGLWFSLHSGVQSQSFLPKRIVLLSELIQKGSLLVAKFQVVKASLLQVQLAIQSFLECLQLALANFLTYFDNQQDFLIQCLALEDSQEIANSLLDVEQHVHQLGTTLQLELKEKAEAKRITQFPKSGVIAFWSTMLGRYKRSNFTIDSRLDKICI
ncbi:hypothetical protein BDN72DRAFT_902024 [Pluteus cervinus]|uniref:Uncharacterized protein n=1 Tax=Pluteus cervinus TaxID=181527 RepID=A0ACD3AE68_9AGAR|nr:hypothetical protein BDN72DRAFT_902024 [Pluteus cervinus]